MSQDPPNQPGERRPRTPVGAELAATIEVMPQDPATVEAELAGLLQAAAALAEQSRAPNTRRAYATGWRLFCQWCLTRRLTPLPADPTTVARWLAAHDDRLAIATLQQRLAAIAHVHEVHHLPSPTIAPEVKLTWQGLVRKHGRRPRRQAQPAVTDIIQRMVATLDPPAGELPEATERLRRVRARDRALLLIGFAGAFRRSELAAVDMDHVTFDPSKGLEVLLARSKTDPEGRGQLKRIPYGSRPNTCPVRAWLAWVEAAGSTDGAAWPRFHRHGRLLSGRLSDRAVSELLKRAAGRAGLNPAAFSGHSLRAGLATAARQGGASMEAIMEQAGWKSSATALRYIRPVDRWRDNAAARTGL